MSAVNICFHHEQVLLQRFNQLQRNCCDPFNSLRAVTIEKAKQLTVASGKHIKPGDKLCPSYRKDNPDQVVGDEVHAKHSASDAESEDLDLNLSQLNDSMTGS